ncbi:MAG TPA: N-acetylmuramoyl-L-alanine amidase, partial [Chthoniobacterales bacterium]
MSAHFFRAGGRVSLPSIFAGALALLLLFPAPAFSSGRKFSTVVIDAGHGGFDRGGIPGQRVPEKVMALDVALRLQKRLRQAGYRVIMTRDSDVFVTLGDRVRIASRYRDAV